MRVFAGKNIYVRLALVALLALFFVICGLHLAGAHHDLDSDSLAVIDALAVLLLATAAWMLRPRATRLVSEPSLSGDVVVLSRWGPALAPTLSFTVQLR